MEENTCSIITLLSPIPSSNHHHHQIGSSMWVITGHQSSSPAFASTTFLSSPSCLRSKLSISLHDERPCSLGNFILTAVSITFNSLLFTFKSSSASSKYEKANDYREKLRASARALTSMESWRAVIKLLT